MRLTQHRAAIRLAELQPPLRPCPGCGRPARHFFREDKRGRPLFICQAGKRSRKP